MNDGFSTLLQWFDNGVYSSTTLVFMMNIKNQVEFMAKTDREYTH